MSQNLKIIRNVVIFLEIIVLILISYIIFSKYQSKRNVLGLVAVVPLKEEDYIASPSGDLKYYYEPIANSQIESILPVWLPHKIVNTINLDTFNERYDYDIEKPQGTFRIVTLGDSFTYGQWVNTSDNWTELLEDKLNKLNCLFINRFEVINLGMGGYGPDYIKERYQIRGIKYNPDLIIWNESGSGFDRVNELFMPFLRKIQSEITDEEIDKELNKGEYIDWQRAYKEMINQYSYHELNKMVSKYWQDFYEIRGNTRVLVTSFTYISGDQKLLLTSWAQGQNAVSFYFELPNIYENGLNYIDGHPNEAGHGAIAESTFNYIKHNFLRGCFD